MSEKKVKVKFTDEHQHDGRTVLKGEVLELPQDLAEFVIAAKKATTFVETPATSATAAAKN